MHSDRIKGATCRPAPALAILLTTLLSSCGPGLTPPTVGVLDGRLVAAGLLDQQLQLSLCITNPNARDIALNRVTFSFRLGGDRLADGTSQAVFDLPPHGSVAVPFAVATTLRDIGRPIEAILASGSVNYVVSGTVILRDFDLIGIPYTVRGRIGLATVAGHLFDVAASDGGGAGCATPTRAPT